jgi:hypothetical protein
VIDIEARKAILLMCATLVDEGHTDEQILGILKESLAEIRSDLAERHARSQSPADPGHAAVEVALEMIGLRLRG